MKVYISPYTLSSAFHGASHDGVLLKVEHADESVGYADLHPWPELGDIPLAKALKSLQDQQPIDSVKQALRWASRDAEARADGRSLFLGQMIPLSHLLLTSVFDLTASRLEQIVADGYRAVKVKMGRDLNAESEHLRSLHGVWPEHLRIRIDMNGLLTRTQFDRWCDLMATDWLARCDVLEDPVGPKETPILSSSWPLFQDRVDVAHKYLGRVVKPEVFAVDPQVRTRWIVSNNLGHPLGHSVALYEAARLARGEICGLQGLQYYPRDAFVEGIRYHGPITLAPSGTGFGFDDSLARRKWREWV